MQKNTFYILFSFIVVSTLYYFFISKKRLVQRFEKNVKKCLKLYPPEIVSNMEKIYRIETNHFKSNQFKKTYSPGMEKFGEKFPYGWKTLDKTFWSKYPSFQPSGFLPFTENKTGKTKYFIKFPSLLAAMLTVCHFLTYYGNNPGRWYSLNSDSQLRYNNSLTNINAKFTEKYA